MTTAKRYTPRWYVESDEVGDSYKETFETMMNAFNEDDAVVLRTSGTRDSYLYQRQDGVYVYAHHTEGRWRVHGFETFEDHPTVQLFVMTSEEIAPISVEETKLYHHERGVKEPSTTFVS
jgi:nitric oxide synthase oxygenase domain/subunit